MRTELKAVVRSTLPEAWAEALTLEEAEVRKPVTCEARTGEADGMNGGDVAEGGEPSETTRRTRQAVRWRSGAANGFDVQWAPR